MTVVAGAALSLNMSSEANSHVQEDTQMQRQKFHKNMQMEGTFPVWEHSGATGFLLYKYTKYGM